MNQVVCRFDELGPAEARRFDLEGHRLCVVRIDESVYVIGDMCSHADVSLSEGELNTDDLEIECWKHGSSFNLVTGEPQTLPAIKPVPVYDAKVVDGNVMVKLS